MSQTMVREVSGCWDCPDNQGLWVSVANTLPCIERDRHYSKPVLVTDGERYGLAWITTDMRWHLDARGGWESLITHWRWLPGLPAAAKKVNDEQDAE